MAIFFTADPHFGHANIIRFCGRPFANVREMDDALIANINAVVAADDRLYILGDFCMAGRDPARYVRACASYRARIACRDVVLIVGNHDQPDAPGFRDLFSEVHGLLDLCIEGRYLTLCHYAMRVWNGSHRGSWQLYGHDHGTLADDPRLLAFDVGVDCHGYRPLSFAEVAAEMARRTEAGPTPIVSRRTEPE